MPQPPSLRKINPAEGSILLLNVSSKTLPLRVVNQYVEDLLIGKLSSVDGGPFARELFVPEAARRLGRTEL